MDKTSCEECKTAVKGESEGNASLSSMLGVMSEVTQVVEEMEGRWGKSIVWSVLARHEGIVLFNVVSHVWQKT